MSIGTYGGSFAIDGVVHSSTVDWYFAQNMQTCLSSGNHHITVMPLGPVMLYFPLGDVGPQGVLSNGAIAPVTRHWVINASHAGSYTRGPLGHPGDGEFDYWPISSFRLETTYTPDQLRVELTLITGAGRSAFPDHQPGPLPAKNVVIWFTVQHAQMAEFYDFTHEVQITELNRRLELLR